MCRSLLVPKEVYGLRRTISSAERLDNVNIDLVLLTLTSGPNNETNLFFSKK